MSGITCKFGGTSLADAAAIRNVESIIRQDNERRFIVPSAPGKRTPEDRKITDLFYTWHRLVREGLDASEPADIVAGRFRDLANDLNLGFDVDGHLDEIKRDADKSESPDFMASRGEYLMGKLLAEFLGAAFIDPSECIVVGSGGSIDPQSYGLLKAKLPSEGLVVVPGYYGRSGKGAIKTLARGGSDITGAVLARASGSRLYENWTDVSGIRMADPRIVPEAKRIDEITYKELRELSYMGATVLHDEAVFPLLEPGIPVCIRNTREPGDGGTMIVGKREATTPVIGIAGRRGFTMINIEKTLMNRERGFGLRVLSVLDHYDVSFEHMPTGIDTMSIIVRDEELGESGPTVVDEIERSCSPDRVTLVPDLAIIATVGQGMNHHIGVAARLCTALANAGINLRVIDQGSSEMNIVVGVEGEDLEKAVQSIYRVFESWE